MKRSPLHAAGLGLLLLLSLPAASPADTPAVRPIEILGNSSLSEDWPRYWVALLVERPLEDSAAGYRPPVRRSEGDPTPLTTVWERPVEFRWNFGDGSGWIPTGERPSIAHEFEDDGDFTLVVEAWNEGELFARGEKQLTVRNKRPRYPLLAATEIDPETNTFELTADIDDAADDEIRYDWDFGDGETSGEWERWRTTHSYPHPGTYTVTVRISDDDEPDNAREESTEIVVAGAGGETDVVDPLDQAPVGAVESGLQAKVSGSFNFDFSGFLRPAAGLYMAPVNHGRRCRFILTAWDDAHLAHLEFIADLPGRPDESGTRYTLHGARFWFNLDETGEVYEKGSKRGMAAGLARGSLSADPRLAGTLGIDPEARKMVEGLIGFSPEAPPDPAPSSAPAASPFGIEDHEGFKSTSSTVDLVFVPGDRASATFRAELRNPDEDSPYPVLSLEGEFALDLQTAMRDGLVLYNQCGPGDFAIEKTTPKDGARHLVSAAPRVGVQFNERFDPATLDESTFQLTYPSPDSDEPVPVEVHLLRKRNVAYIEPVEDLLGGVRYTARVRTGEQGVRSLAGVPLEDEDDSGWSTWSFTTKVDFVPGPGDENLACQVFQSVRDAPLILGKPAVARIYADWKRHPEVDPAAQVEEFNARVVMMLGADEIASVPYRFVRPDRWGQRGIRKSRAEHTANLFWTPQANQPKSVRVALEVEKGAGDPPLRTYWTRCATPRWDLAPEIRIAWFLLDVGDWHELSGGERLIEIEQYVRPVMERARTFARQNYPFKEVQVRFGGVLRDPRLLHEWADCDTNCAANLLQHYKSQWAQDEVAIAFVPQTEEISGGGAKQRLGAGAPGMIAFAIEPRADYAERYTYGVVHELGHVLGLEHLPYIYDEFQQGETKRLRDDSWANDGEPALWYEGIEGYRIASDGTSGWNKSSTEGNEQGSWLTAIMYPSTIPLDEAFIARHHYLKLMKAFEDAGGLPGP